MSTTPEPTAPDPLIEDVRAIRRAIWDECGRDMTRHAEFLQRIEKQNRDRLVVPDGDRNLDDDSPDARRRTA